MLAIDGEYVSGLTQDQFEEKLAKATESVVLVIEKYEILDGLIIKLMK